MAGPALGLFAELTWPPTWQELMTPFASEWLDATSCWVSDSRSFGGAYFGEPRPIVGGIKSITRDCHLNNLSVAQLNAIESETGRSFTHEINIAAMCNDPYDYQLLAEIAAAIAEKYDCWIDFDWLAAASNLKFRQISWSEDEKVYRSMIGNAAMAREWICHPRFHLIK